MHVWQWLLTGVIAGFIARFVIKGPRIGLPGDVALGGLGGLASGAVFRLAGVTEPRSGVMHVLLALIGAVGALAAIHVLLRATMHAAQAVGSAMRGRTTDERVANLPDLERRVLEKFLGHEPVARDPNVEHAQQASVGARAADAIAKFGGSWAFLGLFGALLLTWMLYNAEIRKPFDPYPFILLNLLLSCVAAMQAPIILMSQNRQSEKDRIHARLDYEVNLKAEMEILSLHEKIDELREQSWRDLIALQEQQIKLLEKLQRTTDDRPA